jgi:hypothetical protein
MSSQESLTVSDSVRVASYQGSIHFEIHGRLPDGAYLSQGLIMSPDQARATATALSTMADHAEADEPPVAKPAEVLPEPDEEPIVNLMEALEASLAAAKLRRAEGTKEEGE